MARSPARVAAARRNVANLVALGLIGGGGSGVGLLKHAFGQRMVLPTKRFASVSGVVANAAHMADMSPPWDTKSPQMCFAGWYANELPLGNDFTVEGAWIEIAGVKTDLTVNGQTSFTVPNGGSVWTDENDAIRIPTNTVIRWGWANNAAVGLYRSQGGPIVVPIATFGTADGRGDYSANNNASQLAAGKANTTAGMTVPGQTEYYSPPIAFCAKPDGAAAVAAARSALVVGDSIGWGLNGFNYPYSANAAECAAIGYVNRGLADASGGRVPRINFCVPGTRYPDLGVGNPAETGTTVNSFAQRAAILATVGYPYSAVLCEMGINTVANENNTGDTAANKTKAKALAAWTYLKTLGNRRLIQTTMTPQTLSLNDVSGNAVNYLRWTSADEAKQVRGSDAAHVALDDYIMTKPAPLDDVIDIRPALESSSGSRKWGRPAGQQGTLLADIAAGATSITVGGFLPKAGDAFILDAADTTNNYEEPIVTAVSGNSSSATLTLKTALAKTHVTGAPFQGIFANDGTHTAPQAEVAAKAPVIAGKSKLAA